MLCVGLMIELPAVATRNAPVQEPGVTVADVQPRNVSKEETRTGSPRKPGEAEEPRNKSDETGKTSSSESRKEKAPLTKDIKKSRGSSGEGRSAEAQTASGSGDARGQPTNQGQSGKSTKKKSKKKRKKKKKRPDPKRERAEDKKPEDDSGSTAGRGAASGSNKSPASSSWSSKDQVVSDDEEDLEDDEEVDDEFDNSDARGGVQPYLRDRKPPVNRDLGIGFGNGKNPDANGRGGPSQLKKSRGVASMVLGVPIPDHVKGRPNPGKTKITQERVEPKADQAEPADAQARRARNAPAGHLTKAELVPWMRDLVRSYFLSLRSQEGKK